MKSTPGEIGLMLTILSLVVIAIGTITGSLSVHNVKTVTNKAAEQCIYDATVKVVKEDNTGLTQAENNNQELSVINNNNFVHSLGSETASWRYFTSNLVFGASSTSYQNNSTAWVRLNGLDTNKWHVKSVSCEGEKGCDYGIFGSENNLKINNFRITCGVRIEYKWVVEQVIQNGTSISPIIFRPTGVPTVIPVITSIEPTTQEPSPQQTIQPTITQPTDQSQKLKVLLLIVNPYLQDVGQNVIQHYKYSDPRNIARNLTTLINENYKGNKQPEIVKTVETNSMPPLVFGSQSNKSLRQCLDNIGNNSCTCKRGVTSSVPKCDASCRGGIAGKTCKMNTPRGPFGEDRTCSTCNFLNETRIDYLKFFRDNKVCDMVNNDEIDEVWIGTYPYSSFGENDMIGPKPFNINGQIFENLDCKKNIATLALDYSVPTSESAHQDQAAEAAVHSFLHRIEFTMEYVYGYRSLSSTPSNWNIFSATNGCGTAHVPPNGRKDYDYKNNSLATSYCDSLLQYPTIDTKSTTQIGCNVWGCTPIGYYLWWENHIPNKPGRGPDGKLNNWWTYVYNPEIASQDSDIESFKSLDLDQDNKITHLDSIELSKLSRIQNPLSTNNKKGDFNHDGKVNSLDMSKQLKFMGKTLPQSRTVIRHRGAY